MAGRVAKGQAEYGGASFSADPAKLLEEIREELMDLVKDEVLNLSDGRQRASFPLIIGGENFRVGKVKQ